MILRHAKIFRIIRFKIHDTEIAQDYFVSHEWFDKGVSMYRLSEVFDFIWNLPAVPTGRDFFNGHRAVAYRALPCLFSAHLFIF